MLFTKLLDGLIRYGTLTLIDAQGRRHDFGGAPFEDIPGDQAPRPVTLRLHDPALNWRLGLRPTLAVGEAYMDGTLTIDDGADIYDLLSLSLYNMDRCRERAGALAFSLERTANHALRWLHQHNPLGKAEQNVAHHYDLSGDLYDLFLDADRQYSCAYFPTGTETLEQAQEAKKRHIAAKLRLEPGQRVLDIGCGWGGMALYLARTFDVRVQGVTLSREQLSVARQRARAERLSGQVEFSLRDYRYQDGPFDRIVSVGMFEHVGAKHYGEFFEKVRDLLSDDGVCLLHYIGRASPPGGTNAWLRKYIFPGGYSPALSEVMAAVEKTGLFVTDIEVLRLHYAMTLRHWRERFLANRARAAALYDERFCRMWEFYLAGCEAVFRFDDQVVFQMQITRRRDALPITRDYMQAAERRSGLTLVDGDRQGVARRPHAV